MQSSQLQCLSPSWIHTGLRYQAGDCIEYKLWVIELNVVSGLQHDLAFKKAHHLSEHYCFSAASVCTGKCCPTVPPTRFRERLRVGPRISARFSIGLNLESRRTQSRPGVGVA